MPFCEIMLDGRPVMSSPLNKMRPAVGRSTPVRQLKNVLLPAPFGPMMARTSSRADLEIDLRKRGQSAETDGQQFGLQDRSRRRPPAHRRGAHVGRRFASALTYDEANLQAGGNTVFSPATVSMMMMLAALDLEDELADERLVIFLADHAAALREVVAFLHHQAFERLDQLHGVLAALELRLLHAELERVDRLVVRLHVAVGQRAGRIDLGQPRLGFVEELAVAPAY